MRGRSDHARQEPVDEPTDMTLYAERIPAADHVETRPRPGWTSNNSRHEISLTYRTADRQPDRLGGQAGPCTLNPTPFGGSSDDYPV
jgi:hypothetical protein